MFLIASVHLKWVILWFINYSSNRVTEEGVQSFHNKLLSRWILCVSLAYIFIFLYSALTLLPARTPGSRTFKINIINKFSFSSGSQLRMVSLARQCLRNGLLDCTMWYVALKMLGPILFFLYFCPLIQSTFSLPFYAVSFLCSSLGYVCIYLHRCCFPLSIWHL